MILVDTSVWIDHLRSGEPSLAAALWGGRGILEILEKDEDDLDHMRHVVSYVHRHQARNRRRKIEDSRWRYSLMNWGHDLLKGS